MDIAKDEYITGKNRVQAAVDNMALSFLEIKPKFVDRAREMFVCECQFFLDDAGDELLQDVMNRVFTDWVLFESDVFDSSAIQYYLANCSGISDEDRRILEQVDSNQAFGFYRFDGLFEEDADGNGITNTKSKDATTNSRYLKEQSHIHIYENSRRSTIA